jgi:outer membrane protein OmpA-like peptidoglycan-associated protein
MRCGTRLGIATAVLSVVGAGCATQEWTQTVFAKRQVEVDQRFVKIETDVREHGHRIDGVEVRVNRLDTQLGETRSLLRGTMAQSPGRIAGAEGNSRAGRSTSPEQTPTRSIPETSRGGRTLVAVYHVQFRFDRAEVDARAEAALMVILKELRENPSITIALEGTTDAIGPRDFNMRLSRRRAETVKQFLVHNGVDQARIVSSTGRGPLTNESIQDDLKRRVMVKMMAPDGLSGR